MPFFVFPLLLFGVACRGVKAALTIAVIQECWNILYSFSLMLWDPWRMASVVQLPNFLISSAFADIPLC